MGSASTDRGDDGSPHEAVTVAHCRAVVSMARAARLAASDTCQRVHLCGSPAMAAEIRPGHARASGQRRATVANRCARKTSAVADCSPYGRGWGITTARRLAAATSATAPWPACVTTTSAAQICCQGSSTQQPSVPPIAVHVVPGHAAAHSSTGTPNCPLAPAKTRTLGFDDAVPRPSGGQSRPSKRLMPPT